MNEQELETLRTLARERQAVATHPSRIQEIAEAVAIVCSVTVADIFGELKFKSISEARSLTFYVSRCCTRMSYPELGRAMGFDQSTVRSAFFSVQKKRARDRWTDSACAVLLEQFGAIEESKTQ